MKQKAALCKRRTATLFSTFSSSNLNRFTFSTSVVKEIHFIFERAVYEPVACFYVLLLLANSLAILGNSNKRKTKTKLSDGGRTTQCTPSQGVKHCIIMCHSVMLLESDVSPFLKRGSDQLGFPECGV